MIIQATPYGTTKEEPFAFTYSGSFVDERDANDKGDVTLNTSGDFIVTEGTRKVSVYILAAGGGGAGMSRYGGMGGGGGGNQTVEVELVPGTYSITIGKGGTGKFDTGSTTVGTGGGKTVAFGFTSTGGSGGVNSNVGSYYGGAGGTPNGGTGESNRSGYAAGGSPNGGSASKESASNGGNGLVRITFS